ncbi:REST corepressor 1 [Daphnia magna]|uniref:REST corepressor 3 n=2 Tax=Daphnia magna TaxID=35525 RepID=A0A0N8ATZ6_9CRUS|nr:REST corepressor 1 [Daphnia magna]KAK4003089.1 hypothetical protein OUZ56_004872 [Daphnia magna]KZS07968.1 REST corepressor 3 [Daphnia magna]
MVSAETEGRAIGNKRSRGASPNNGHYSGESEEDEREGGNGGMRVGRDYQAQIPLLTPIADRKPDQYSERALLVWSPTNDILDAKLEDYISVAKEKYGYNSEQALGMLFWHKHDLEKALIDLSNFTPFPDEWSVEDKVLFEQAFQFHGKSFHRIRQMLPDKSIAALVRYYYSWKKTRARSSLMDRQVRRMVTQRTGEDSNSVEAIEPVAAIAVPSDSDEDRNDNKDGDSAKSLCLNCGINCSQLQATAKGALCATCANHLKRTGVMRPTTGPIRRDKPAGLTSSGRHKRKPPRGMYLDHEDLMTFCGESEMQSDAVLKGMDGEIVALKRLVQKNKQVQSVLTKRVSDGLSSWKPPDNSGRINARWTNEELLIAVQGVRKYGKDFKAIADVIGTKNEAHVRLFFISYRKRYNLDAVLREYEEENGPIPEDEKMELEMSSGSESVTPTGRGSPVMSGSTPQKSSSKSVTVSAPAASK